MNYLAHLLLAGDDPELRLGGLFGDFVRGRLETLAHHYPPAIMRGIALHRAIDSFTDRHPRVAESKRRFSTSRRRFSGVIVDVLHDHFLSRHWSDYSAVPRRRFIADSYALLSHNHRRLPPRLQRLAPLMIDQDWLGSYHDIATVGEVYERLSHRFARRNTLTGAIDEVQVHYAELEQDFRHFFPELVEHARRLRR